MSTGIEWTDETWNPSRGCSKVSEGCRNCYAMKVAHRFSGRGKAYDGLTHLVKGKGPQWTGRVELVPEKLEEPLRWRKPKRVFVNSMSDLFHPDVPFEFVDQVFAVMAITPWHTYQVLTKRPERMAEYSESRLEMFRSRPSWGHPVQAQIEILINRRPTPEDAGLWSWPLPNVWLGTSVEDQAAADERIPHLFRTPAAVRFLSCEPLLGPVNLGRWPYLARHDLVRNIREANALGAFRSRDAWALHWIIIGGESGPGARPCDIAWIRDLVRQGRDAGVAVFVKQLGARPESIPDRITYRGSKTRKPYGFYLHLSDRKGGDPEEWPADLRVREWPEASHA